MFPQLSSERYMGFEWSSLSTGMSLRPKISSENVDCPRSAGNENCCSGTGHSVHVYRVSEHHVPALPAVSRALEAAAFRFLCAEFRKSFTV